MALDQSAVPQGDVSENRHAAIFGLGIGFIVFDAIVIALRIYVRGFMLRALGTDDILMIIGTILNFGLSITIMIGSNYGIGKHALAMKASDTVPMLKCIWVTRVLYTLAMGLIKMSLLWFYLRLDPRKYMRWSVFFVMFINIGLSLASFFGALFGCTPPSLFWINPTSSRCMAMDTTQRFYEINGILNIVTDVLIYLLPIPMLYSLQLSWRKKGAIMGVFGLGILSVAAGCIRYDFVKRLAFANENYYLMLADSLNWCTIEAYIAIFCGSAPSLSVLVKKYVPFVLGTNAARYPSTTRSPGPSYLQRRNILRSNRRRGLGDTTLGSQDAIVNAGNAEQDHNGIMMKTHIQTDVEPRKPGEDMAYKGEYYNFSRKP